MKARKPVDIEAEKVRFERKLDQWFNAECRRFLRKGVNSAVMTPWLINTFRDYADEMEALYIEVAEEAKAGR